jgi:hypothetical protein
LPENESNPWWTSDDQAKGLGPWLTYKEAKARIKVDAVPAAPTKRDGK